MLNFKLVLRSKSTCGHQSPVSPIGPPHQASCDTWCHHKLGMIGECTLQIPSLLWLLFYCFTITFLPWFLWFLKSFAAVKRVLEKQHTIDGNLLNVSQCSRSSTPDVASPGEPQELTTVSVRGLSSSVSNDTLLNYFENHRRSGGGDVVEVTLDSKTSTFYVTFQKSEGQ